MISPIRKVTTNVIRQTPQDGRHFSDYHRFLSHRRWSVGQVGQVLLDLLLKLLPFEHDEQGHLRLYLVLDHTFVNKVGRKIAGTSYFLNPHGGMTQRRYEYGNRWLVVGLLCSRFGQTLCLPIRAALYRRKKDCPQTHYRPARLLFFGLIDQLRWPKDALLTLIGDGFFASKEMIAGCRQRGLHLITRLKINARVCRPANRPARGKRGRARKYGCLIDLRQAANDAKLMTGSMPLYKRQVKAKYHSFVGVLRRSGDTVRVVVVKVPDKDPVFLICTDLDLPAERIIKLFCDRFQIEMTFRDLKQHHGFGEYQSRSQKAVERHGQLAVVACSLMRLLTLTQETWLVETPLRDIAVGAWNGNPDRLSANQIRLIAFTLCVLQSAFRTAQPRA